MPILATNPSTRDWQGIYHFSLEYNLNLWLMREVHDHYVTFYDIMTGRHPLIILPDIVSLIKVKDYLADVYPQMGHQFHLGEFEWAEFWGIHENQWHHFDVKAGRIPK